MFKNQEQARWYLAGVVDGEGNVGKRKVKGKAQGFVRDLRVTNTDHGLLDATREALDMLGVTHKTYDRSERERLGSKPIFDVVVSGKENLEILVRELPLQTEKGPRLAEVVGSYLRKNRPPLEVLEPLVATQTDREIASRYGVTPGAVYFWRKHYGLTRR